ncbi:MAG: biopolymer transporter ExbD, partial [Pseudomonadota bacterium]
MALRTKKRRRGASITSLIDVIFLLLLFFMLASTFSRQAEIEFVSSAQEGGGGEAPNVIPLLILSDELQLNGRSVAEAVLASSLNEELSQSDGIVAIELGEDVTTQRLIDILLVLRS